MLSYNKDLIPDIYGQHLNNSLILNQHAYKFYGNLIFTTLAEMSGLSLMETVKNS